MTLQKLYPARVSIYLDTAASYANYAGLAPGQQRVQMPPHSPNMVLEAITKSTLFFPTVWTTLVIWYVTVK